MNELGREKTCRLFTSEDFRRLLNRIYEEQVYVDYEVDGIYIGLGEDAITPEDLHERLASALGVNGVTSIHIDDYEMPGVWAVIEKGGSMLINSDIRDRLICRDAGNLTFGELYNLIVAAIEPYLPDILPKDENVVEIMPMLDYGQAYYCNKKKRLSEIEEIDTALIRPILYPGDDEGIWLDISLMIPQCGKEDVTIPAFTFKTLKEDPIAYAALGAFGGMITYAMELFLNLNF